LHQNGYFTGKYITAILKLKVSLFTESQKPVSADDEESQAIQTKLL